MPLEIGREGEILSLFSAEIPRRFPRTVADIRLQDLTAGCALSAVLWRAAIVQKYHTGGKMPNISEMVLTATAEDIDDDDEDIDDDSDDWDEEE